MGLFDSRAKKQEAHRRALAEARAVVERCQDTAESIPIEFHQALGLELEELTAHIETTAEKDLGDARLMHQLGESLSYASLFSSGRWSEETQTNARTAFFDTSIEELTGGLEQLNDRTMPSLAAMPLERAIPKVETALRWFAERPVPRSKKYSADQARTMLALAKQSLASHQAKHGGGSAAPHAPARRPCAKCGKANDPDATFCAACGHALGALTCAKCGVKQDADAAFCKRCGVPPR